MTFPDEVLMAYADDELDARARAAVEAAMAADPEIARRIAQHKALRSRVHSAFDKILDEPVPARLLQVVRSEPSGSGTNKVVQLRAAAGAALGVAAVDRHGSKPDRRCDRGSVGVGSLGAPNRSS